MKVLLFCFCLGERILNKLLIPLFIKAHFNMTDQRWYVLKVKFRYERAVQSKLQGIDYEVLVPVQPQLRRWSDRVKKVETVLFNGYVFISCTPKKLYEIRFEGGILGFVRFENRLAELCKSEYSVDKKIGKFGDTGNHLASPPDTRRAN
jgi:hypothetical protein